MFAQPYKTHGTGYQIFHLKLCDLMSSSAIVMVVWKKWTWHHQKKLYTNFNTMTRTWILNMPIKQKIGDGQPNWPVLYFYIFLDFSPVNYQRAGTLETATKVSYKKHPIHPHCTDKALGFGCEASGCHGHRLVAFGTPAGGAAFLAPAPGQSPSGRHPSPRSFSPSSPGPETECRQATPLLRNPVASFPSLDFGTFRHLK